MANKIKRLTLQSGVPEGYVLVPMEPTEEMIATWRALFSPWPYENNAYYAMLSAVPQPPVQPPEGGTRWPVLPCRFSARGCQDHAVGIFHVPEGCHCWPDPIQALCAQHACKADSPGPIVCVIDFSIPSPPGLDVK